MQQLREAGTVHLQDIIHGAADQLQSLLGLKISNIVAANRAGDGWQVTIEMIERKAIPDTQDLLGIYEVHLDDLGELTGYERREMRRRMDLVEMVE